MSRTRAPYRTLSASAITKHYDGFLRSLRNKRPETRGTYGRALREFLRWSARGKKTVFSPGEARRYKKYLTFRKKLSPVSVSTYMTSFRRFCDYLVHTGVLNVNPASDVGGNSRPLSHSRAPLSAEDVQALLVSVDRSDERGARDFAFIQLMVGCGLSEIEIVRADVEDAMETPEGFFLQVQGKGRVRKDQSVTLQEAVREALRAYLVIRGPCEPHAPLFISAGNRTRGRRMTTRGVRDRVTLYLERSGIKRDGTRRISPYSLRHTAALLMAGAGATADEIRTRMRLGSVATAKMYMQQRDDHTPAS
jgi:integrase/recombinase XerC/integrase/recombinase XerD